MALLVAAITYFTRLPVSSRHDSFRLNDSLRYLPVIGWMVGGTGALVFLATSLVLPPSLAVLLSMTATLILTGALHEDGLADTLDGMGAHSREDVLRIMKDPRTGVFGTIGLIMSLAIKFFALLSLPDSLTPYMMLAAHSLSRAMAGSLVYFLPYARKQETTQSAEFIGISSGGHAAKALPFADSRGILPFLISALLSAIPLALLDPRLALAISVPLVPVAWIMARYYLSRIGGYTGDCLGAVQQVTELLVYLVALTALRAPWISI